MEGGGGGDVTQCGICYGSVAMRGDGRYVNETERVGREEGMGHVSR